MWQLKYRLAPVSNSSPSLTSPPHTPSHQSLSYLLRSQWVQLLPLTHTHTHTHTHLFTISQIFSPQVYGTESNNGSSHSTVNWWTSRHNTSQWQQLPPPSPLSPPHLLSTVTPSQQPTPHTLSLSQTSLPPSLPPLTTSHSTKVQLSATPPPPHLLSSSLTTGTLSPHPLPHWHHQTLKYSCCFIFWYIPIYKQHLYKKKCRENLKIVCILLLLSSSCNQNMTVLLDIEFHELHWRIFTSLPSTQSGLYRVRGGAGELLSEVWRIVEWATTTAATVAFTIPERIIWMKTTSRRSWVDSWFTEIVSTHKWWDIYTKGSSYHKDRLHHQYLFQMFQLQMSRCVVLDCHVWDWHQQHRLLQLWSHVHHDRVQMHQCDHTDRLW